ncbi:hypothetical protein M422DRAFT_198731 [Sphaerobolus stellatus SS14]|nr:hypothetical protein M422DRAFT_198731 [Sphaerobolus stellatus SS14]
MSTSTFIHFETLRERVASNPDTPVFKLPKTDALGKEWIDISYRQFQDDIERMARHWYAKLSSQNIPARSVVGIWLRGFTYSDVVTIFSISRAGFIPQMFGFELPDTRIVFKLLAKYDGKALIHDPAKTQLRRRSLTLLPCFTAVDYTAVTEADVAHLPLPALPHASPEDYTFIYHSSGSVSGMPKVVPNTNKWLSTIQYKSPAAFAIGNFEGQDVYLWTESFSHSMEICLFQLILHRGACLVQPTRIDFDSEELSAMITSAGVNRIIQFTNVLRKHLEDAQRDPSLLKLLKNARQVTYAGMPLPTELEKWAMEQGIPLTNNFGCTECGQLFSSTIGDRRLQLLPNISCKFEPVSTSSLDPSATLLELWILPDSPDLPVQELRTPDGGWRSGDLFEEAEPGKYIFRGRDDDWIKSLWSEKLDTKSIEDNVYTTCPDLVANCVVVGNGRPQPALFVEPRSLTAASDPEEQDNLRREIIARTTSFNELRYLHERIQDPRMIKIVPLRALPRTAVKGNIRRRAVEEQFADELEAMYTSMPIEEVYADVLEVPKPAQKIIPSDDFTTALRSANGAVPQSRKRQRTVVAAA